MSALAQACNASAPIHTLFALLVAIARLTGSPNNSPFRLSAAKLSLQLFPKYKKAKNASNVHQNFEESYPVLIGGIVVRALSTE